MPMFIILLIIEVALVVHVIKTGRSTTWVYLLLIFPLVGALAYLIVELAPEWMGSRRGRHARRSLGLMFDPDKGLKDAYRKVEIADTVNNRMALAEQCLLRDRHQEAKDLYQYCLNGFYANDPTIMLGLAKASMGMRQYQECIQWLDALKEKNPQFKSADGHLLYARAQEGAGNVAAAIHEYEALVKYYSGAEPTCRLGLLLKAQGDTQRANELFSGIVKKSKFAGRHFMELNKGWVTLAKRELDKP